MSYKVETSRDYKYLLVDWSGNGSKELIALLEQKYNIISYTSSDSVIHYILEKVDYDYPKEKMLCQE